MFLLGQTRYVDLRIINEGSPVTGLALSSLTIFFTRNAVICTDALTLIEVGSGRYALTYVPSAAGHDYLEISYPAATFFLTAPEDIISTDTLLGGSSSIQLTQDTPTPNALQVTQVINPNLYTLYVYESSDWQSGNTETYDAIASTQLDGSGNWLTTPLFVTTGTYHIVIRDGSGAVQVIKAYLQV